VIEEGREMGSEWDASVLIKYSIIHITATVEGYVWCDLSFL